jgi:hypothetical protein
MRNSVLPRSPVVYVTLDERDDGTHLESRDNACGDHRDRERTQRVQTCAWNEEMIVNNW